MAQGWQEASLPPGLNGPKNDYAPAYNKYDKKLYFTSERGGGNAHIYLFQDSVATALKGRINQEGKSSMYISFSDKNTAYYSAFVMGERQKVQKIFLSKFTKNSWQKGTEVTELDLGAFASQPSVSPLGDFIVFCATASESSIFDTDLYISYLEEGKSWGKPIALDVLNTEGRELTPHLWSQDSLFFASDGLGGKGGLELFLSVRKNELWQRPEPLHSLNTEFDESDPCLLPNGDIYFVSKRGNDNGLNIYFAQKDVDSSSEGNEPVVEDVYLSTFASNIRIRSVESKTIHDFNPYFFYEKGKSDLENKYAKENKRLVNLCLEFLKKQENSLEITAWTASEIELDRNENYKNSKFIADERISRIKEKLGKYAGKIKINYEYFQTSDNYLLSEVIGISFEGEDFFVASKEKKYELLPDKLEIQIQSRAEDLLDSCKIELLTTNGNAIYSSWSNSDETKILIDLSAFGETLNLSEDLILKGKGVFGSHISEFKSKLPIFKSKISSSTLLNNIQSIKLIIIDDKTLNSQSLKNYLDKNISTGSKINIYYNPKVKPIEKIAKELKKNLSENNQCKLIQSASKSGFVEGLQIELEIVK